MQEPRHERARLSGLTISYLIENKDGSAVRELSTGIRTFDGTSSDTHEPCFVQILAPRETVDITDLTPPRDWWEEMTDQDRAVNFVYWAVFTDEGGRRWEATYDPQQRKMNYSVLRRRGK